MATDTQTTATIDDLYGIEGKAELICGRIVHLVASGRRLNRVAGQIYRKLADHVDLLRVGEAYTDNIGFAVGELASGRQSFSPDVSYFAGPFLDLPMRFVAGAPAFAVEVRSENDYGPAAEAEIAAKRADYFEAGTLVVWDVDPVNDWIRSYSHATPDRPTTFLPGQEADAEPAVPGWGVALDWIFARPPGDQIT